MVNIGNGLKYIWTNYVAPTVEEQEVGKKELYMTRSTGKRKDSWGSKKLSTQRCIEVADQCPIVMKGIRKSTMDSVRSWHSLETWENRGKPVKADLQLIHDFSVRVDLRAKWKLAIETSKVTGDGYILIIFDSKDDGNKMWDKPVEDAAPYSLRILDSRCITEINYPPAMKVGKSVADKAEKTFTMFYRFENKDTNEDYWVHPERILHIPCDKTPDDPFGNSKINLLRNIIQSKVNIDIAAGEILAWFAHGVFDIKHSNCEKEEIEYWEKKVDEHPSAYIHDDEVEIKPVTPEAIDPQPFYDYVILNIAAALRIPKQVLTGNEPGRVTGAEVGFGDYYKDIKDSQELVYTPVLKKLYSRLLSAYGKTWKYNIVWNPIYIDEQSEAVIMKDRVEAASKALGSGKGGIPFITKDEARGIFNKGQIVLSEKYNKKELEKPEEKTSSKKDDDDDADES